MISLCIVLSLFVWLSAAQQQQTATTICPQPGYLLADNTSLCYSYKQTSVDFFAANRSCVREGAILLSIESASEDVYIWRTFFNGSGGVEFWIGLNDLDTEGIFRWLNSSLRDPPPTYTNWSGGAVSGNLRSLDCAKFTSTGWMLHSLPCSTSSLFYVCKMFSCRSNNGEHCIGEEPTVSSSSSGVEPWVLAVIIVVLILVIVIIGIIILLVILWKFNNDAFNRYCCCCLSRGAQSNVHSLQQENQRLRHELSQHKLSTSGRYSQGQFARELSGVPDGRGGVLPTIKAPLTTQSIPENQPLTFGTSPPPLVPQRVSTTRVTPLRHPSVTTHTSGTAPFGVFTSGNAPSSSLRRQSAPVLSGLNQPLRAKRSIPFPTATTIEEEKNESEEEGVSSSEEESEHSALDKTDKGTTE